MKNRVSEQYCNISNVCNRIRNITWICKKYTFSGKTFESVPHYRNSLKYHYRSDNMKQNLKVKKVCIKLYRLK